MISVTLITLNEEKNILKVLENIKGFADEIIIVDSGSVDKTLEIAKGFKTRIFYRKFDNFANQKNWAQLKAKGEWILSIDADEEMPINLKEEIKQSIKSSKYDAYFIPRRNFILGKEIKHSRWSPDKHIWLWKKDLGKWVGGVHEELQVKGNVGELKNSKIHHSHKTLDEFLKSNDFYSTLLAKDLFKIGVKFSFIKMFWDAFFEFNVRFFYKLGFLDGWNGFVLAYCMGIYKLTVWIKLWELEKQK